jgi:hypothetical protein
VRLVVRKALADSCFVRCRTTMQLAAARRWMRVETQGAQATQLNEPLPELGEGHRPGGSIADVSMQRHMQDSFGYYHGALMRLEEIRRQRYGREPLPHLSVFYSHCRRHDIVLQSGWQATSLLLLQEPDSPLQ